jgi:hypothetical protein
MVCGLADPDGVPEKAVGSPLTVPFLFFAASTELYPPPIYGQVFPGIGRSPIHLSN